VRIGFDARYVRVDHHDGISRFSARIVAALAPLAVAAGHEVVMLIHDRGQLAMLPDAPWILVSSPTSLGEPWVSRQLNRHDFDVVFSPMQTMGSRGRKYRLVLTVHDLIYYVHRTPPRQFSWFVRALWRLYHLAWWPQRMLLNGADAIVAVSQTTKDLIARHRLTRRPVFVVHNATDLTLASESDAVAVRNRRNLVYMGSFMPYKNVDVLAQAMQHLPEYTLHLLSKVPVAERRRLESMAPAGSLVFHNGVTDGEYLDLLASSVALLTASLDEGFGIPLIEAMNVGTPVIVSDIPIFREIGGDAALFVDPRSASGFAHAVRLLDDPDFWGEMSRRAREQAQEFSWTQSAQALLDVLVDVSGTE
jgi:glycosyltransferase involved in cell wall biosynthesis